MEEVLEMFMGLFAASLAVFVLGICVQVWWNDDDLMISGGTVELHEDDHGTYAVIQ